jgi:uncharacterized protein YuzB (UPF0349 family)
MERRKFVIDGREYETYELSNEQLVHLANSSELMGADKAFIKDKIVERFMYDCCARCGEDNDDVFARQFGNFVNGKMRSKKKVAEKMSHEHRYLQNEMFKVCLEYIKVLAENCENGWYDPRNQYAAETSKKIIDYFKEIDYPY